MRHSAAIVAATMMLFAAAAHADDEGASGVAPLAGSAAAAAADGMSDGSPAGGSVRLDPLLPGGGGVSASGQLLLFGSVGQPTVTPSYGTQHALRPGFWTPVDAAAADRIFSDGFE